MEEISKHLDQHLQDKADNPCIYNWVEVRVWVGEWVGGELGG